MGKQFQAFILLGLTSGLVSNLGGHALPDIKWLVDAWPGVVVGLFLFFAGIAVGLRFVSGRVQG